VGEGVDTVLFVFIAFLGVWPTGVVMQVLLSNYVFKVALEAAVTPITYTVVNFLKRAEQEDYYDYDTDFNPFAVRGGE